MTAVVGRVLGTLDAMPLEFWVGVEPGQFLQLDDVVVVETPLPHGDTVRLFGVVDLVRARHEGAKFDSDVFLIEKGVLPAQVSQAAHVRVTRVEPEIFVPPLPGQPVRRAQGVRARPGALLRLDGAPAAHRPLARRRARLREPGFPRRDARRARQHLRHLGRRHQDELRDLPASEPLQERGPRGARPRAPTRSSSTSRARTSCSSTSRTSGSRTRTARATRKLGLPVEPFDSVQILAPVRPSSRERLPDTGSRQEGVSAFFWTLREFVEERLLRFLFAEADDAASQLAFVVDRVEAKLAGRPSAEGDARRPVDRDRGPSARDLRRARGPPDASATSDERSLAEQVGRPRGRGHGGRVRAPPARRRTPRGPPHPRPGRRASGTHHRLDWRRAQVSVIDIHAPARPGQALRGGRRPEADVRGEGDPGHRRVRSSSWCSTSSTSTRRARARARSRRSCSTSPSAAAAWASCSIGAQQTASEVESRGSWPTPPCAWWGVSTWPRRSGRSTAS